MTALPPHPSAPGRPTHPAPSPRWHLPAVLTFALAVPVLFTGCGAAAPPTAAPAQPAEQAAAQPDANAATAAGSTAGSTADAGRLALLTEVRDELAGMRLSRYQHRTEVHRDTGEFFYDCSGFADYALGRARPGAEAVLPSTASAGRPLAQDFEHYLRQLDGQPAEGGWAAVPTLQQLQPGDVIAWLTTPDSKSRDTGHVMVVLDPPRRDPHRADEWTVHIADSTTDPHAEDSRHDTDGLGTGTVGLTADSSGRPTGFYWKGGVSRQAKHTEVAMGRPS